jgi:hypothetical protein
MHLSKKLGEIAKKSNNQQELERLAAQVEFQEEAHDSDKRRLIAECRVWYGIWMLIGLVSYPALQVFYKWLAVTVLG